MSAFSTAELRDDCRPVTPIGLAALARMAFAGEDLAPLGQRLIDRVAAHPSDAAAMMDLATVLQLTGDSANGLMMQLQALDVQRLYRRPAAHASAEGIRLLAFVVAGDFMANTPLDFLLEGTDVRVDMQYVVPGQPWTQPIPDHDVAFVAVGESDQNQAALRHLAQIIPTWPRPVLNAPSRIGLLTRDGAWDLLNGTPGVAMPMTARIERETLAGIGRGAVSITAVLDDGAFPILARPVGSHAGNNLAKLDTPAAIEAFLQEAPDQQFYVSRFVDYAGADGLFRKYRVAFIDGRAYACHMAISSHWMVHYLNAGMLESPQKRAEEARFMAEFDEQFARRHATAIQAMTERLGLDYYGIDCAETPDGELLVFEVDVAMIVHAMDPPDVFPYKQPQMRKVCDGFRDMLRRAARAA